MRRDEGRWTRRRGTGATLLTALLLTGCFPGWRAAHHRDGWRLRESLRPTDSAWELYLTAGERAELERTAAWVGAATPSAAALQVALLALVAASGGPEADPAGSLATLPELVAAQLAAGGRSPWPPLEPAPDAGTAACGPLPATGPRGLRWVLADLHVHSAYSHDSAAPLRDLLVAAVRRGVTVLAITDHDRFSYREAVRVAAELERTGVLPRAPLIVPGEEVSTQEGHLLVYFLDREVPGGLPAQATAAYVHAHGGLVVVPHPYRPGAGLGALGPAIVGAVGVERVNGADLFPTSWRLAELDRTWSGLAALAASDAHFAGWVGVAVTCLAVTAPTLAEVRAALLAGRTHPLVRAPVLRAWATLWRSWRGELLDAAILPRLAWDTLRRTAYALAGGEPYLRTAWDPWLLDAWGLVRAPAALRAWRTSPAWRLPLVEAIGWRRGAWDLSLALEARVVLADPVRGTAVLRTDEPPPWTPGPETIWRLAWPAGWRVDLRWTRPF